jgi:hypothetical protein
MRVCACACACVRVRVSVCACACGAAFQPGPAARRLPQELLVPVPAALFQSSLLLGSAVKAVLGDSVRPSSLCDMSESC